MTAKLRFENRNRPGDVIEIYRTDSEIKRPEESSRIAVLPGDAINYTDQTAIIGSTYFYVVVAMEKDKPLTRIYNHPFKLTVQANRGPGSQTLVSGNARLGYFGMVPPEQLPFITFGPYTDNPANRRHTAFLKIIRNNKIIYAPNGPFSTSLMPDAAGKANQWNMRSGTPLHKRSRNANPDIYKDNIVTIDGYRFHLRLMYGAADNWTPDDGAPNKGFIEKNCETYDIFSLLSSSIIDTAIHPAVFTYFGTALNLVPSVVISELWGGSPNGQSGTFGAYSSPSSVSTEWASRVINQSGGAAISISSSSYGFMLYPVLELIEG